MQVLGEGRFVRLIKEESYEFVERKGCTGIVSIVAITEENELVFVEQYRAPLRCRTIELAAGLAGDEGDESLESAARRELLEETGYKASSLQFLFVGPSAGGITTAQVHYYLAPDVVKVHEGGGVADEDITVHVVPANAVHEWLQQQSTGEVMVDPKAFLAVAIALQGWRSQVRETP